MCAYAVVCVCLPELFVVQGDIIAVLWIRTSSVVCCLRTYACGWSARWCFQSHHHSVAVLCCWCSLLFLLLVVTHLLMLMYVVVFVYVATLLRHHPPSSQPTNERTNEPTNQPPPGWHLLGASRQPFCRRPSVHRVHLLLQRVVAQRNRQHCRVPSLCPTQLHHPG